MDLRRRRSSRQVAAEQWLAHHGPRVPGYTLDQIDVAPWHSPPPADPIFLRRLSKKRWEQMLPAAVMAILLSLCAIPGLRHLATIVMPGVVVAAGWFIKKRPPRSVASLVDLPAEESQFAVEVTYRADFEDYGFDSGVLTFVGPWARFEGLESEFSIQKQHVLMTPSMPQSARGGVSSDGVVGFVYAIDGGIRSVIVKPYDRAPELGPENMRRFWEKTMMWLGSQGVEPGNPTFPPQSPSERRIERLRSHIKFFDVGTCLLSPLALYSLVGAYFKGDIYELFWIWSFVFAGGCALLSVTMRYPLRSMERIRNRAQKTALPPKSVEAEEPIEQGNHDLDVHNVSS